MAARSTTSATAPVRRFPSDVHRAAGTHRQSAPAALPGREVTVKTRHRRRSAAVLLPGLFLAAPAACSSGPPHHPYLAAVRSADRQATSDFERQVFADGRVTEAEYEEAVDRYVRCANERGVEVTKLRQPAGYYGYTYTEVPAADGILSSCAEGTTVLIEPIYVAMVTNPQAADMDDLIAA